MALGWKFGLGRHQFRKASGSGLVGKASHGDIGHLFDAGGREELGGALANKAFERACEVRLVGIAGQLHRVEDGDPLAQERRGLPGPCNLADGALG